jgi:hypothetical protein
MNSVRNLTLVTFALLLGGCLTLYTQNNESLYLEISRSYEETLANLDDLYRSCHTDACREEIDRRRAEAEQEMRDANRLISASRNNSDADYALNEERGQVQSALAVVEEERARVMSGVSYVRDWLTVLARVEAELRHEEEWDTPAGMDQAGDLLLGTLTFGIGTVVREAVEGFLSLFGHETAAERLQRLRRHALGQLVYATDRLAEELVGSVDRLWAVDAQSEHVSFDAHGLTQLNVLAYHMRDEVRAIPAMDGDLGEANLQESLDRQLRLQGWLASIEQTYSGMEDDLRGRDDWLARLGVQGTSRAGSINESLSSILGAMNRLRDDSRAAGAARESAAQSGGDPDSAIMCPGVM